MGFYHPSTLVKDAQRHGVRFATIDVQVSDWLCRVEPDGRVRLGLMYVNGLRKEVGQAIADCRLPTADLDCRLPIADLDCRLGSADLDCRVGSADWHCPKCGCDDASMLEVVHTNDRFCNVCSHVWQSIANPVRNPQSPISNAIGNRQSAVGNRFSSLDDLIRRTGIRRDEIATLAEIGALNGFGFDRRTALWQIEQAIRPAGELFESTIANPIDTPQSPIELPIANPIDNPQSTIANAIGNRQSAIGNRTPLRPMSLPERLIADYAGTSLTVGPHPMSLRRAELALRGVQRAIDLPRSRHGRRVRVAGAVITRQRPGTAKGFVFLTLEDETGIANVIVRPDLFSDYRATIVGEPYLLVEGILQIQEGVTSVKAERLHGIGRNDSPEVESHDFR
jgi:error-prone DNA polymerase